MIRFEYFNLYMTVVVNIDIYRFQGIMIDTASIRYDYEFLKHVYWLAFQVKQICNGIPTNIFTFRQSSSQILQMGTCSYFTRTAGTRFETQLITLYDRSWTRCLTDF